MSDREEFNKRGRRSLEIDRPEPPVTADHTPERLSAEDREALLVPCVCGHTLNDHGDLAGCWLCPEENRECDVTCEALIVAGVERILAAHLADVEARPGPTDYLRGRRDQAREDREVIARSQSWLTRAALHPDPSVAARDE